MPTITYTIHDKIIGVSAWRVDAGGHRWASDTWGEPARVEAECAAFNAAIRACVVLGCLAAGKKA